MINDIKNKIIKNINETNINISSHDFGLFMIKPCGRDLFSSDIIEDMSIMLNKIGLTFQFYKYKQLNEHDIIGIYPHILQHRSGAELEAKIYLLNHLMSKPVLIGFTTGTNANLKINLLKLHIRLNLVSNLSNIDKKIKNIIHAPDEDELYRDFKILFQ